MACIAVDFFQHPSHMHCAQANAPLHTNFRNAPFARLYERKLSRSTCPFRELWKSKPEMGHVQCTSCYCTRRSLVVLRTFFFAVSDLPGSAGMCSGAETLFWLGSDVVKWVWRMLLCLSWSCGLFVRLFTCWCCWFFNVGARYRVARRILFFFQCMFCQ